MEEYDKISVLGRGSFGLIHLCRRRVDNTVVVVKQINAPINEEDSKVVAKEVSILSSLRHRHIVRYFDTFTDAENRLSIVMEWARGGSLEELIQRMSNTCNGMGQFTQSDTGNSMELSSPTKFSNTGNSIGQFIQSDTGNNMELSSPTKFSNMGNSMGQVTQNLQSSERCDGMGFFAQGLQYGGLNNNLKLSETANSMGPFTQASFSNTGSAMGPFTPTRFSNTGNGMGPFTPTRFSNTGNGMGPFTPTKFSNTGSGMGPFTPTKFVNTGNGMGPFTPTKVGNTGSGMGPFTPTKFSNTGNGMGPFTPTKVGNTGSGMGPFTPSKLNNTGNGMGPFTQDTILTMLAQLVDALAYLHSRRIVHRDLCARNILLCGPSDSNLYIKLCDFGVSKMLQDSLTESDGLKGSLECLSPEQCLGLPYTTSCDVWALGCLLHRLITLKHPFPIDNMATLTRHLTSGHFEFATSSQCEPRIMSLMSAMLSRDPHLRPTAHDLLHSPLITPYLYTLYTNLFSF